MLPTGNRYDYSAVSKNAYLVGDAAREQLILPKGHRIKNAGIYYAAGYDSKNDDDAQRAARRDFADWLRVVLPPLRNEARLQRPAQTRLTDLPGIDIDDGGTPSGFSPLGESQEHKDLREWVMHNPLPVAGLSGPVLGETEVRLDSADRVDVTYTTHDDVWVVEVKSRRSLDDDHFRGIYQCVKYRAVMAAMRQTKPEHIRAILVTEKPLIDDHQKIVRDLGITHFKAPMDR